MTVAFYSAFWILTEMVYLQLCLVITWLIPCETAAVLAHSVHTSVHTTMFFHFVQSLIYDTDMGICGTLVSLVNEKDARKAIVISSLCQGRVV